MATIDITLPIELTNGNDGRQKNWYMPAAQRKRFENIISKLGHIRKPLAKPCRVTVTRILGKNQKLWDYSSILRGNYKELEDAAVACGWWHDDGPKWIVSCHGEQDATQRENGPAVRIVAVEVE